MRESCAALAALGGPELTREALAVVHENMVLHTDAALVGEYGAHSAASRAAAQAFDASGRVTVATTGADAPPLWLCGHFVAKAYAAMLVDLEKRPTMRAMLWQTKSATQPRASEDEWVRMQAMPKGAHEWANAGVAESALRPGSVDVEKGTPDDYRGLMTRVGVGPGVAVAGD